MYFAGLLPLVNDMQGNLEYVGSAGCPIMLGVTLKSRRHDICALARDQSLEMLRARSSPIIWVQRWETYDDASVEYKAEGVWSSRAGSFTKLEDALFKTLSELTKDRRVLLIGAQVPAGCEINRPRLLQGPLHHATPRPCPSISREKIESMGAAVNDVLARVSRAPRKSCRTDPTHRLFMRHKLPRFSRRALALLGFDPLHSGRLIPHDRHGERTRASFS